MLTIRSYCFICIILLPVFLVTGCGTVKTVSDFGGRMLAEDSRFAVGDVSNKSGADLPEANPSQLLRDALTNVLEEENMLAAPDGNGAIIDATLAEYEEGNAFKRWMLPGWGATVVTIKCNIKDNKGLLLGTVDAHRTVSAGGGFTIGAWKTIFKDAAQDVVTELKEKHIKKAVLK